MGGRSPPLAPPSFRHWLAPLVYRGWLALQWTWTGSPLVSWKNNKIWSWCSFAHTTYFIDPRKWMSSHTTFPSNTYTDKQKWEEYFMYFTSEDVRHFAKQNSNWSPTIFKIFRLLLAKIERRRVCCKINTTLKSFKVAIHKRPSCLVDLH